jgi:hypothetical protein
MVRMRAGITEQQGPDAAAAKLRASLEAYVPDEEERAWVEPRLAQLVGAAEQESFARDDLFAAWRLFFERLTDQGPTVLVFEDLQWADAGLLEFVDYVLDWSRGHPLFVLTLARPELSEKHPRWSAAKRDFTSLTLEPLSDAAMDALLAGLVPGLPDELRARIGERAEACRSTPSRRCGCCSTEASFSATATSTSPRTRSARSRSRRRCTRSSPRASTTSSRPSGA